ERRRRPGHHQSAGLKPPAATAPTGSTRQRDPVKQQARRRSVLDELRVIAKIAGRHRSPQPSSPTQAPVTPMPTSAAGEQPAATAVTRWGELVLIERVGVGSFGVVYRAYDPQLDRPVAVKLLRRQPSGPHDPAVAAEILREARTLARVRHPNVVTVY